MKRTRNLWFSVLVVAVLVVGSVLSWFAGIRPLLGLDLEGGVSVTLSAPTGTPESVMGRTLESIRNRVDAFGVGEPDIFVTGTNIEVQIPGLANGTIEQRPVDQVCLLGDAQRNFGCFDSQSQAQQALDAMKVQPQPERFCLYSKDQRQLGCFETQKAADQALQGAKVSQQGSQSCLVGADGTNYECFDSKQAADAAQAGLTTRSSQQFCVAGSGAASFGCYGARDQAGAVIAAIATEQVSSKYCVVSSAGSGLGCFLGRDGAQARLQETGQRRLIQLIGTTARLEEREVISTLTPGSPGYDTAPVTCATQAEQSEPRCSFAQLADQNVTYLGAGPDAKIKYQLGPVQITGDAIKKATAVFSTPSQSNPGAASGWLVSFQLTSDGAKTFGDVTTRLNGRQLAIILDEKVISAPTIQEPITSGNGQITGGGAGGFTEQQARDLATTLNAGALPVQLTQQQLVTVSPTLGQESLHQGLIAGIVGLIALAIYLLFYYRLLGVVAWLGMTIWAVLAMALVSLAGRGFGYALTLAGIAGLVISLGVTADSYIVFFERLKDEVRNGKSPRAAVQPAFRRAYKTIVAADIVAGLAALGLYLTAVSSVRGFALTLGVATVLDLFVVYFFKRPTVFLIARNPKLVGMRGFGLRSGVAADMETPGSVPVAGGSK